MMRCKWLNIILILLSVALFVACDSRNAPIPRRYAYPMIDTYPESYTQIPGLPLNIEKNDSATVLTDSVQDDGNRWITIYYPRYNSHLYLTLSQCTTAEKMEEVVSNRTQRIALNTGGNDYEQTEITNNQGFTATILKINGSSANPVMFIATDRQKYVVSGIFYIDDGEAAAKPDSVSPIRDAAERDIIHLSKNLR